MAAAGFTDKRLAKRLRALIAAVGSDPSVRLPEALDSAELEGAYRFFSNVLVTPNAVLAGHFEATRKRCEERGEVLVAHDTTGSRIDTTANEKGSAEHNERVRARVRLFTRMCRWRSLRMGLGDHSE